MDKYGLILNGRFRGRIVEIISNKPVAVNYLEIRIVRLERDEFSGTHLYEYIHKNDIRIVNIKNKLTTLVLNGWT